MSSSPSTLDQIVDEHMKNALTDPRFPDGFAIDAMRIGEPHLTNKEALDKITKVARLRGRPEGEMIDEIARTYAYGLALRAVADDHMSSMPMSIFRIMEGL